MTTRTFALSRQRRRPTGLPPTPAPDSHEAGLRPPVLRLPHERDESVDPPAAPREPIVQAERDLAEGKVDTDLRARAADVFERAIRRRQR